jgi:hypothetical protein
VIQASFFNPTGILFVMDEAIEISSLSDFSFLMDPKINYDSILYDEENLSLEIYLADSIQNETEYGVQISGISDCSGNELNQEFNVKLDFQPPQIIEIYMYHANELQILFDEPPVSTSLVRNNFSLEGVVPSKINAMDSVTVSLVFEEELENEKPFELNFQNLKDFRGNVGNGSFMFTYIAPPEPGFLDILITEVMIDPEPGLGTLPISQYVEIFNSGTVSFSLKGIALSDGNSETKSSTGILEPGEFALLVPSTQKDFFADYGSVIAMTSWPGLNISGELISIKNRRGQLLHQIDYNTAWYKDLEKQDGGWSLEMIDLQNPCG